MKRDVLIKNVTEFLRGLGGTLDSKAQAESIRLYGTIQRECAAGVRLDQKVHLYAIGRIFQRLLEGHDAYHLPTALKFEALERDPGTPNEDPEL